MDKLYIGDIPKDYHYARYGSNYIDLYNSPTIPANTIYDYYRVYLYDNIFIYDKHTGNTSYNIITTGSSIDVTDEWYYRRDMPSIMFMSLIEILIIIIIFNIVTSVFKKGGLLGGLL